MDDLEGSFDKVAADEGVASPPKSQLGRMLSDDA